MGGFGFDRGLVPEFGPEFVPGFVAEPTPVLAPGSVPGPGSAVGVGGIGSHVLQQLAYLGVKEIVVVDDDKIDQTNLNRLVGAKRNDSNKYKTKVLSGNAKRILSDSS